MPRLSFARQIDREKSVSQEAVRGILERFWPELDSCTFITGYDAQRSGCDVGITLTTGEYIRIDLKHRFENYDDVLLELYSENNDTGKLYPGWTVADSISQWVVFTWPDGRAVRLPMEPLRTATKRLERKWRKRYGEKRARSKSKNGETTWYTICVAVPLDVAIGAITDSFIGG